MRRYSYLYWISLNLESPNLNASTPQMKILRSITFFFLLIPCSTFCQEKPLVNTTTLHKPESPIALIHHAIKAIQKIKSAELICESTTGIPYMPYHFLDPFIIKERVSIDPTDPVQGANFISYLLKDTFQLQMVYDGKQLIHVDQETDETYHIDLSKDPSRAERLMGSLHLRIKNILDNALKRKASLAVVETNDSLKLEITFPDLYIECTATGVAVAKDTAGFVSRYVICLDKYTHLPVKLIRDMPHHTTIETILYQKINYTDTLEISAGNLNYAITERPTAATDSLFAARFTGQKVTDWKLMEVAGDSIRFSDIKGRRCIMVFNSVGWKSCRETVPFLKALTRQYADDLALVSIDPFINNAAALKHYKQAQEMNYPLLVADAAMKKHYPVPEVPVFMLIGKDGIIQKIVIGFTGEDSETAVRQWIRQG